MISPQTFLLLQEIDPFYSPKFWTKSLSSIHSEYEFLYDMKPANSGIHDIERILEEGNVLEDKDVTFVSASDIVVSASDVASQRRRRRRAVIPCHWKRGLYREITPISPAVCRATMT